ARSALASRATPELAHRGRPQRGRFAGPRAGPHVLADPGVHHDQPALWIDEDRLTVDPEQREHAPLTREDPRLIPVAEQARRESRTQMRWIGTHRGGVPYPRGRDELAAAPVAVVREQEPETGVVAQDGVDAAERGLVAGAIHEPRGVSLGAHRLPDLLFQVG